MTTLTQNEYTDSFHFGEEICEKDPNLFLASLDVDSLFINIPLEKIIDICIDSFYKDDENTPKIPKDVFRNLFTMATKELLFMFSNKFYEQIVGVNMGSPQGPGAANIFLCSHSLKPVFCRRYVDDIVVLFFQSIYFPNIPI